MTYTVLEPHADDNILVIKYFFMTTNFSYTYVHTYSDLSNPGCKSTFQVKGINHYHFT